MIPLSSLKLSIQSPTYTYLIMSRVRRLDRLILSECIDDTTPLDSEDQDLLISQLTAENETTNALYIKLLVLSVVAEFPVISYMIRAIIGKQPKYMIQFILLSFLCLIGSLYDISAVGNRLRRIDTLPQNLIQGIFSFKLLCVINGLMLLQFYMGIYRVHGLQVKFMFVLLPLMNFVIMIMVRQWHTQTATDIRRLHDLRYKFKTL